jgi:hypothetical protein
MTTAHRGEPTAQAHEALCRELPFDVHVVATTLMAGNPEKLTGFEVGLDLEAVRRLRNGVSSLLGDGVAANDRGTLAQFNQILAYAARSLSVFDEGRHREAVVRLASIAEAFAEARRRAQAAISSACG